MNKIVIISGPTASGKTAFAIDYAIKNNGIIINADSRQIFKGLPILSAQPSKQEKGEVKHLLYDLIEPTENFSVGKWLELVKNEIDDCFKINKIPIIVGGTGMYISKLINGISQIPEIPNNIRKEIVELYNKIGYEKFREQVEKIDIEATKKINPNDKQRIMRIMEVWNFCHKKMSALQKDIKFLYPKEYFYHINFAPPKEKVYANCEIRFYKMLEIDVLNEVQEFKNKYNIISNTLGYGECLSYINKEIDKETMVKKVIMETRHYAKRQYTWFRHQFEKIDEIIV